jgi:hypothetical protein
MWFGGTPIPTRWGRRSPILVDAAADTLGAWRIIRGLFPMAAMESMLDLFAAAYAGIESGRMTQEALTAAVLGIMARALAEREAGQMSLTWPEISRGLQDLDRLWRTHRPPRDAMANRADLH